LKDLSSRNGTFLNGTRLRPGDEHTLNTGAKIAFGKQLEGRSKLVDTSAPITMAIPVDGGDPAFIDGELLALPSTSDPQATIYRSVDGQWVLEQPDESTSPITNSQTFEVSPAHLEVFVQRNRPHHSRRPTSPADLEIRHLDLSFSVSRDEEHVELQVRCGGRTFDMGARTHNYLLLTLARRRPRRRCRGHARDELRRIYQEDLAHDPSMAPPQLNIDVFRIRKQFAAICVIDAANIIERRPRTRQLRIGTALITVAEL